MKLFNRIKFLWRDTMRNRELRGLISTVGFVRTIWRWRFTFLPPSSLESQTHSSDRHLSSNAASTPPTKRLQSIRTGVAPELKKRPETTKLQHNHYNKTQFVLKMTIVKNLKCPYYGFLRISFHAVCNTALSEWIILQSLKSESALCIKLLSLKRESWNWIIETSRF